MLVIHPVCTRLVPSDLKRIKLLCTGPRLTLNCKEKQMQTSKMTSWIPKSAQHCICVWQLGQGLASLWSYLTPTTPYRLWTSSWSKFGVTLGSSTEIALITFVHEVFFKWPWYSISKIQYKLYKWNLLYNYCSHYVETGKRCQIRSVLVCCVQNYIWKLDFWCFMGKWLHRLIQ